MLCCVSRKSVGGSGFKRSPLVPPRGVSLTNSADKPAVSTSSLTTTTESKCLPLCIDSDFCKLNSITEKDEPPVLLPCAICGRTFKPQSLEKHTRICERSATKKRKPFDSSKQRMQGTELEEFLPKQIKKRNYSEERSLNNTSWKQTHDDFIKTIRAARGESVETTPARTLAPIVAPGAPTRANEKGTCPTCNRQFGIKAYDRHVAWCKDRVTRMPSSPATNMAKERLDARMKYRAPALKNRRMTNRDKYSPNSNFKSTQLSLSLKPKKSVSLPSCVKSLDNHSPIGLKQSAISGKKIGQERNDGLIPPGPVKSRLSDRSNTSGISSDYDPFLLAERQMLDLLSDTCSDQSFPDSPSSHHKSAPPHYPLSHSSAFVKYPNLISLDSRKTNKRGSLIAPPTEFDDLSTGFSSDSTETNSISRELFINQNQANKNNNNNHQPILGRRIIIDKSKALGQVGDVFGEAIDTKCKENSAATNSKRNNEKVSPTVVRPQINRSNSLRAASAPKIPERNNSSSLATNRSNTRSNSGSGLPSRNNNYSNLSGSNLSLSSIISSEIEVKHSNSVFEDLVSSFEDDVSGSFPSLRSLLKNDSFSSPIQPSRNGQLSDEDLSSPDSYHKKDLNKLSADSAYSSLNRKYSNGRSTTDVAGKLGEQTPLRHRDNEVSSSLKSKMSKFCHECGTKFPQTAKFCCECGVQRLAI
ncbi:uncharacterized protein LOC107035656 isoform X2 [Diachasma alloeum]|uniref:uncharacterized protein LOC107035656 isoform X2 n=1 Tax=Diachasma alloeum TaxID=454923 RepID=UPI0007381C3A|nr:uncharacterized protein LOC107035656 isoform X2 [Diachasma alloeum]